MVLRNTIAPAASCGPSYVWRNNRSHNRLNWSELEQSEGAWAPFRILEYGHFAERADLCPSRPLCQCTAEVRRFRAVWSAGAGEGAEIRNLRFPSDFERSCVL